MYSYECIYASQFDDSNGPLCPPNSAVIRNQQHTFPDADTARKAYLDYMQQVCEKDRVFWDGALYRNLFHGYYDTIHSHRGECIIQVADGSRLGQCTTRVSWWRSNDTENTNLPKLRQWCRSNITNSLANCRLKNLDQGTMVVFGWRSKTSVPYASNDRVSDLKETMVCATDHFRKMFPDTVTDIAIRTLRVRVGIKGLEKSAACEMVVSKNLVNACHIDILDKAFSVTTWVEDIPGQTKGKFFILPFTSRDGSKALVFPITDGQSIAWDGRIIKHCSGEGDMGQNNSVYGIFLSSKC